MVIWRCHMISLVIISNIISLSPPIAFIYHLVPNGSLFQYIKSHSSNIGNWLPTLHYWKAHQPLSHLFRNASSVILMQFRYRFTNIPFIRIWPYLIKFCWESMSPLKALWFASQWLGHLIAKPQLWTVAWLITKKCFWFIWSFRTLVLPYRWYEARLIRRNKYSPLVFDQPNCYKRSCHFGGHQETQQMKVQIIKWI